MSRIRWLAAAFALAAVLAACGGDDTTPSAGGTSPGATSTPTVNDKGTLDVTANGALTIEMDDRYFKPTFIKAKPGQSINVELENEGTLPHNFSITSLNIDETVQPGGKAERTFTLPAGDVTFFCKFHADDGMRGGFFFGAAPNATSTEPSSGRGY